MSFDGPGGLLEAMENSEGKVADLGATTLTMSDKMDTMKNKVKNALTPIGSFATALGPIVIMLPAMTAAISAMAASQVIATAATWAQSAAMAALNIAMGPIGLIIIGIGLAIAGVVLAIKNWDTIITTLKETWDTAWGAIKTAADFVWGLIETAFTSKFGWLLPGGALLKAIDFLKTHWDTIWTGMKTVVGAIANPIIDIINTVISAINGLLEAMRGISVGWEEKRVGGDNFGFTVPAFRFAPFEGLPTIPKIPKLASGGIVTSPTLAMIGESGPEAVIPLGRGGAGGITINILGPTYGFDDFEEKVTEAIQDGVRRGGFGGILATA